MDTVGAYLRLGREHAGLSLEQVSRSIKVRSALLAQLESDRLEELPQGVVLRGFVRSYADAVGVDAHRAISMLEGRAGIVPRGTMSATTLPTESAPGRLRRKSTLLVVLALLGLLGAYLATSIPRAPERRVTSTMETDVDSGTTRSFAPLNQ